ncbi:hypothetical protein RFI_30565, partial [Reticulomyxa filosa]
ANQHIIQQVILPLPNGKSNSYNLLLSSSSLSVSECTVNKDEDEWTLELIDYEFKASKDRAYIQYQVCVYPRSPYLNNNSTQVPVLLEKLFLQIPCNCDLCIDFVTKDMDTDGLTTELDRECVWEVESIEYLSSLYDATYDITTIVWRVNTSSKLPNQSCKYDDSSAPLTDVTIRLGCDCEHKSNIYLLSITQDTTLTAVVIPITIF